MKQEKIRTALEAEHVDVTDAYGNGQHVSIDVVSDLFEGQSSMKRQRMVYKVGGLLHHAMSRTTCSVA